MDTSKYFGYSDLTNTFEINTDNISTNIIDAIVINSNDIKTDNIIISGDIKLAGVEENEILSVGIGGVITSKQINGTTNQINIANSADAMTLSLSSDVSFNNLMVVNNLKINSLSPNTIIGTDASTNFVGKAFLGTDNQIQVTQLGNNITLSTYQDLNTTSNVTFGDVTSNGQMTCSTLSTNSIVATNGAKQLINRTLAGTTNQITINTAGTTTTISAPQDLAPSSNVTFNSSALKALYLGGGADNNGAGTLTQHVYSYRTGGYNHFVRSRHNVVNDWGNGIDFFLNTSASSGGSSLPGTGNSLAMSITAGGVGIGKIQPTANLDVSGSFKISGTGTFSNTVTLSGLTASTWLCLDSAKNITSINNPLISSNVWTGTNNFNAPVVLSTLTPSSYLGLDSGKNIVSLVNPTTALLSSINYWSNTNTFTENPVISNIGQANIHIAGGSGTGFSVYSNNDAGGLQFMDLTTGQALLNLRNAITPNKLMVTDSFGYVSSSSYGVNDLVLTSGTQTIAGNKTLSGTVNMGSLTASTYLGLDGSKNIVSMSNPGSALLSTDNTWTGINTFSGSVKLNGSTGASLLAIDSNKNIINAPYAIADSHVWTNTNVFQGIIRASNPSNATELTIISGNATNDTAKIYFGLNASTNAYSMTCYNNGFSLYNHSTGRSIFDIPKTSDTPEFPQSISSASLTASKLVMTDANKKLVSSSVGEGDLPKGKYVRAHTASNYSIPNMTVGGLRYSNIAAVGIDYYTIEGGDTTFYLPQAGAYLIQWTVTFIHNPAPGLYTYIYHSAEPSAELGYATFAVGEPSKNCSYLVFAQGIANESVRVMVRNYQSDGSACYIFNDSYGAMNRVSIKYIGPN